MASIEFSRLNLGNMVKNREYSYILGKFCDGVEWKIGPGPSGEMGVKLDRIYNFSDKEITSVEFFCVPIDAADDPIGKEMKCVCHKISLHGENECDAGYWDRLWCAPTAKEAKITKARVLYADGTEENLSKENIKYIFDEDSLFKKAQKTLEEKKEKAKKEKEENEKAEKEKKEELQKEDRSRRGIVSYAGVTDSNKCIVKKVGDVTFYFDEENRLEIVGWESTREVECLELPDECGIIAKECVKDVTTIVYPRSKKEIHFTKDRPDLSLTDFSGSSVNKIVIPKEATFFTSSSSYVKIFGRITEIEFENPRGWGVKKSIIRDPKKMCEFVIKGCTLQKQGIFGRIIDFFLG